MDSQSVVGELIELLHHGIPDNLPDLYLSLPIVSRRIRKSHHRQGRTFGRVKQKSLQIETEIVPLNKKGLQWSDKTSINCRSTYS